MVCFVFWRQIFTPSTKAAKSVENFISNSDFQFLKMAKRGAPTHHKLFGFDLESLLISDLSPERQHDSQTSTLESCKSAKKFRTKDETTLLASTVKTTSDEVESNEKEENDKKEEGYDVTKFFENVGNDFNKSLQVRNIRLGQFTEAVSTIYHSRITEMIKKQEDEIEELKDQTVINIEKELNKCEEEFKKLKHQENKLTKILEQQMKILHKAVETQSDWIEHFRKLHENFIQDFETLKHKHRNETLDLKKSLTAKVSDVQNKFLMDSKKEEMETVKKYLSSIYF